MGEATLKLEHSKKFSLRRPERGEKEGKERVLRVRIGEKEGKELQL